jgi:kynurenine formamidase
MAQALDRGRVKQGRKRMSVTELMPQTKAAQLLGYSRMVDISLVLDQTNFKMQVLDGFEKDAQFELEVVKPYSTGDGQIVRAVHMRVHAGSHVDAPAHQLPTGKHIHDLPLERFIGDAIVADFTDKVPGGAITPEDFEKRIGKKIRKGDRLLLRTDVNNRYFDMELSEWKALSPAMTPEARHWIVDKGISMVGFDMHHGARPKGETRNTSKILPTGGVLTLPYLTNLDQIKQERVTLMCFPLNMINVEASPVRAIVLEH